MNIQIGKWYRWHHYKMYVKPMNKENNSDLYFLHAFDIIHKYKFTTSMFLAPECYLETLKPATKLEKLIYGLEDN